MIAYSFFRDSSLQKLRQYLLIWTIFTVIFCFFPLIFQYSVITLDLFPIAVGFQVAYYYSLVASMAASLPFMLDLVIDFSQAKTERYNIALRCTLLLTSIIFNGLIFYYVLPTQNEHLLSITYHVREIIYIYLIICILMDSDSPELEDKILLIVPILYSICGLAYSFVACVFNPIIISSIILYIIISIKLLAFLTLFCCLGKWCYNLYANNSIDELFGIEYRATVYVLTSLIFTLCSCVLYSLILLYDKSIVYFIVYTYLEFIFAILISILNGRVIKQEAVITKDELETKRTFVRYISHELRTPLNIVLLGLTLLNDEINDDSISPEKIARLATLKEITESCDVVVTILNDLLTLDKIENDTLQVDVEDCEVLDFIISTTRPFSVQARQAGIELRVEVPMDLQKKIYSPIIKIDRNKMSQVIRNLLSNALKFTPRGGTVTVQITCMSREEHLTRSRKNSMNLKSISNLFEVAGRNALLRPQYGGALAAASRLGSDSQNQLTSNHNIYCNNDNSVNPVLENTPVSRRSTRVANPYLNGSMATDLKQKLRSLDMRISPEVPAGRRDESSTIVNDALTNYPLVDSYNIYSRGNNQVVPPPPQPQPTTSPLPSNNIRARKHSTSNALRPRKGSTSSYHLRPGGKGGDFSGNNLSSTYLRSSKNITFESIRIRVIDNGEGISKENQVRLFQGAVQFNSCKMHATLGPGLGIFISKGIVELHNGYLGVYSEGVGYGSTFYVDLPLAYPITGDFDDSQTFVNAPLQNNNINNNNSNNHDIVEEDEPSSSSGRKFSNVDMDMQRISENMLDCDSVSAGESKRSVFRYSISSPNELNNITITSTILPLSENVSLIEVANTNLLNASNQGSRKIDISSPRINLLTERKNSTFRVNISDIVNNQSHTTMTSSIATSTGWKPKILIVDDSTVNRRMMARMLGRKSDLCHEAENGEVAIARYKEAVNRGMPYDLILMDFIMPIMDGPTATRTMRSMGYTGPLFGVTGNALPHDIQLFLDSGANRIILKPIANDAFDDILQELSVYEELRSQRNQLL